MQDQISYTHNFIAVKYRLRNCNVRKLRHKKLCYVLWRTINLGRQISDISKKSMQATIYCHYD
jgi:hypothetical protein